MQVRVLEESQEHTQIIARIESQLCLNRQQLALSTKGSASELYIQQPDLFMKYFDYQIKTASYFPSYMCQKHIYMFFITQFFLIGKICAVPGSQIFCEYLEQIQNHKFRQYCFLLITSLLYFFNIQDCQSKLTIIMSYVIHLSIVLIFGIGKGQIRAYNQYYLIVGPFSNLVKIKNTALSHFMIYLLQSYSKAYSQLYDGLFLYRKAITHQKRLLLIFKQYFFPIQSIQKMQIESASKFKPEQLNRQVVNEEMKKQDEQKEKDDKVSLLQLFRFAECYEYILLTLGIIFAMVAGCSFPWFAYLWGKILDSFLYATDAQQRLNNAIYYRNIFFYIGIGALFSSWIAFACWTILSERLAIKCRKAYMNSLLRQDIGWFDLNNQFELSSQFNKDALAYQKATGEKIGSMFNLFAMFVCGAAIAISLRWTMGLVILATLPVIGFACIIFIYLIHRKNATFQEMYEQADLCAHQALNSIKTVKSMNGQEFEEGRYARFLNLLKEKVVKWAILAGLGTGLFFFIQYCAFSFGFWYGTHCVAGTYRCSTSVTGTVYTPGDVTIVFFALFVGSFNFMQLLPNVTAILEGLKAAKRLYHIIDLQPAVSRNIGGLKLDKIKGKVVFQNVTFAYPKDKSVNVLKNLSLEMDAGAINAFVGDSGCGKSTIIQLVMRFYDPDLGRITLDGNDLKDYDLEWLRSQIGYVGQEPCLFEGTVHMNILIGNPKATIKEVNDALDQAEALDFVENLPGKLDYNVGYGGSQLSGGQKQRIAIARAILRKPQILILDEATSALDRRNQKLIQSTLDKLTRNLTTLTIAHRIKTIMNASTIFVLSSGKVVEFGKFRSLNRFKDVEVEAEELKGDAPVAEGPSENRSRSASEAALQMTQIEHRQKDESVYGRLFSYTEGRKCLFFVAILACIIAGAAHPGAALLLANILNQQFSIYAVSQTTTNSPIVDNGVSNAESYVLGVFLLAIFIFFPFSIQSALFTFIGQEITEKIRKEVYHKLLRLPVKWFQKKRNRGGAAANRFGVDTRQVNSLATSMVSTLVMNFSSIIVGMILAFIFEWRLGLVGLVAMPCMVAAGFISMLFYGGFGDQNKKYYEESAKISQEAILNIRTVYSCCYENRLGEIYDQKLKYPQDAAFAKGTKLGLLYGFSQLILQFTFGVLFYFGALIMRDNPDVSLLNIFYGIMTITWAGWYSGNNFYFMPDVVEGKQSAKTLFGILDTEDEDQIQIRQESKLQKTPIKGNIEFRNVSFGYNHTQTTLNNLNLSLKQGEKIAFVGPSGCGKSTMMQLLQRFYDCTGLIMVDGVDIKDYDVHHLRSHFAIVSQEPSLFTGTLKENIKYNKDPTQEELAECTIKAEALKIVQDSKDGYDRDVGVLGSQLSGGQKQRVAIARALLRKPQILMLDEATSALDRRTEMKVQANIDKDMVGKTCLVVAHRIETIQNSDRIYMFDQGEILEEGTYAELMAKKKNFYNLERGEQLQREKE